MRVFAPLCSCSLHWFKSVILFSTFRENVVVSAGTVHVATQCHQIIKDPEKSKRVHGVSKNEHNV